MDHLHLAHLVLGVNLPSVNIVGYVHQHKLAQDGANLLEMTGILLPECWFWCARNASEVTLR